LVPQKINTFLKENHFIVPSKGPNNTYQEEIQQSLQRNNIPIKHGIKYLLQINPAPSHIKAQIKIRKEDIPI
jgi:hypothetical protein